MLLRNLLPSLPVHVAIDDGLRDREALQPFTCEPTPAELLISLVFELAVGYFPPEPHPMHELVLDVG